MPRRLATLAELPVTQLGGVGPKQAIALREAFGVETVLDVLMHYPRNWIDRSHQVRIGELRLGEQAMVVGTVSRIAAIRGRGKPRVALTVSDGSGRLQVTFFNQTWRERQLPVGTQAVFWAKVDEFRGQRQMVNPVVDLIGDQTGRIIPVYPQSEKHRLNSWEQARWVAEVLRRAGTFDDPVPAAVLDRFGLVDRTTAFRGIHAPESFAEKETARKRLVFDELLRVQLALVLRKRAIEREALGVAHVVGDGGGPLVRRFHERLGFELTGAQRRAIGEITADLAAAHPMHRLLQGDVGSGKTVVAVSALLVAAQGGHQGALMAPTEVLAEQHAAGVRGLLDGFTLADEAGSLFGERPLRVELLTSRTPAAERRRLTGALAEGRVDLLIGTHALISEGVDFASLGVVVIDEQHRFGVEQRAALKEKGAGGAAPDVLVMTATPIPRTAAMTVYGDLDVSVLDELPPGRTPITTVWVHPAGLEPEQPSTAIPVVPDPETLAKAMAEAEVPVWEHVRAQVAEGRQVYVVCPLIEESERLEARSAQETFDRLADPGRGELRGLRLELLHGRMPAADKEAVMDRFRLGAVDVLVATTVIEVGVDVANATVMVVLDADRFGIAQLHQLRGRVGRGASRSWCYLVGTAATPEAGERLAALERSTDGFELAEIDLDLRGEGTIMGERQKGRNDLRLASLRRDREWVRRCREVAFELVDADAGGDLSSAPLLRDEVELFLGEDARDFLLKG